MEFSSLSVSIIVISALLENILSISPVFADDICKAFSHWMIQRISDKEFGTIKLYCTELMAILIQQSNINRDRFLEIDGISVALSQVAVFRKRDPNDADESEFMENLFDILCSCSMSEKCKEVFLKEEGIELMVLMLKYYETYL